MRQVRNRSTRVTSQIDRVFIPSSDDPSFIDATTREYVLLQWYQKAIGATLSRSH